jgi:thiamine-phosphate pyrophosphorylase
MSQALTANARRAEESLRVLEELAKTADTGLDGATLQNARFAVYALEKTLMGRLLRHDKTAVICSLHAVIDTSNPSSHPPAEVAREMLLEGVRVIQLQGKPTPQKQFLDIALEISPLCRESGALLIVKDALDIALAANTDGLHLSQDGLSIEIARQFLPFDRLIGYTVQNITEAKQAQASGADYLSFEVGTATTSNNSSNPSYALSVQISREVDLPLIAFGSIAPSNIAEILRSGADGIATVSTITTAASVEVATRDFIKAMEVSRESSQ